MAVSNDELFAWVQQTKTDLLGVSHAMGALDLEEARDVAARLFSYLAGLAIVQDAHIDHFNANAHLLPEMTLEEQPIALLAWIEALPLGTESLARIVLEGPQTGELEDH
ncbi:MAG: hypothetical protein JWO98_4323 [Frankiales bacterium]|nr:hypothetical protein [Frankiales bacterium]